MLYFTETEFEKSVFDQWQQDDDFFYSTKATKEVENLIKNNNLVMVTGHSGSGKSAIIQHIALKYRKEGWIVKPVYKFQDIHDACKSMNLKSSKCMFVFNNPIGRESFDEVLYDDWLRHRETLNIFIVYGKLFMSCRKSILLDKRVGGFFKDKLKQIDINDSHCKLTTEEKEKMFQKHLSDKKEAKELFAKICDTEIYFPLLCKLYKGKLERNENVSNDLHEPVEVLKDEIESYKNKDKEKYCALVCLILSNNELCINDLKGNNELFSLCLQLCELPTHTSTDSIRNKLDSLEGFFVKTIGKKYSFYNDFIMEVTTHVFGSEHPRDTIKFADLSFLRKRIKIENSQSDDFLTIVVNEDNIVHLVDRFFEEMFGSRFIEVVLNPCLRHEHVINGIKNRLECLVDKKKLEMIIKFQKKPVKGDLKSLTNNSSYSRLKFVSSETEPSPLFALIAFCHDELSMFCLNLLREENINLKKCGLFAAMCSNGNDDLFRMFTKDEIIECKEEQWNDLYSIHIVSMFHNYNLLDNVLIPSGGVNMFSTDGRKWTSLHMASVIEVGESNREESTESDRRDKTVEGLIQRGADVNICNNDGQGPLHIACYNGHGSTAELLLQNGAKVNLSDDNKSTPILEACRNGHENTVQVLLQNGAEVNKRDKWGTSPITRASENGHTSTVQLLLQNGAMVNILDNNKSTPLLVACRNGHKSTVQILLNNGAMVNILDNNKSTPLLVACRNGHENTVRLLLQHITSVIKSIKRNINESQLLFQRSAEVNKANVCGVSPLCAACMNEHEHENIAQLLLQNGAEVNKTDRDGSTPLFKACLHGHKRIAQLLLQNGAEVNKADWDGNTPLFKACHYGHESIVQLLLQNGAEVNKAKFYTTPLYAACSKGHESIVQLLLQNGAKVNIFDEARHTPLYAACSKGHENVNIVQLLLQNGAEVNQIDRIGRTPLFIACHYGHESTVQLLLQKGAEVNTLAINGSTPILEACRNGHENIVKLLLQNGAKVDIPDKDGVTPILAAIDNKHESIVQLLKQECAE